MDDCGILRISAVKITDVSKEFTASILTPKMDEESCSKSV